MRCLAFPLVVALCLIPSASGQRQEEDDARWEGTHVFRRSLFEMQFQPLRSTNAIRRTPSRTILVVLGRTGFQGIDLERFLQRGGAVLFASDLVPEDVRFRAALQNSVGVSIQSETIVCRNPNYQYKEKSFCPIVQPTRGDPLKLFQVKERRLLVATNQPSRLDVARFGLKAGVNTICRLPIDCESIFSDGLNQASRPWGASRPLLGVAGRVGNGKVVVLADHSIFINAMMVRRDNKNVEFGSNCMTWLSEGANGKRQRTRVLLLENGNINSTFEVPLTKKPLPDLTLDDWRRILAQVGPAAAKLEDNNVFDKKAIEWLSENRFPPSRLAKIASILGTLALAIYLAYRITRRGRHHSEPHLPSLKRTLRTHEPFLPQAVLRREALLDSDSLFEAGRELARSVFRQAGVPVPSAEGKPTIHSDGGWWSRFRKRRWARRLWRLAYGARAFRIRRKDWPRLLEDLQTLRTELTEGTLRIDIPEAKPARLIPRATPS